METTNAKMIEATSRTTAEKLGVMPAMIRALLSCDEAKMQKFMDDANAAIAQMTGENLDRAIKMRRAGEIILEVRAA